MAVARQLYSYSTYQSRATLLFRSFTQLLLAAVSSHLLIADKEGRAEAVTTQDS
jgi:hypothetical protein